jgi:DNA-binding NtrC family response regulator
MPEMDGMALLGALAERAPGVPVIMLTAHANVENAVEAMKRGAADFLAKPFDRDEVLFTVGKALATARHAAAQPERARPPRDPAVPWLGASAAMRETAELIARAAKVTSTVLLRGESGAGKEVAARAIHAASDRQDGPFVPVHCAALPENLLESELFGYEKGAFTGATNRKPGRVELAQGGTLFLDEIGDVSPSVQVKLLRLLQEKEYQRLGGTQSLAADVRFVAATHRDLEAMVEDEQFREDLFYRLNVIPIWIAPLRERREDVAPLARRFCEELGDKVGRPGVRLDAAAIDRLTAEEWPGNVRELSNFVERLIVFTDGDVIGVADVERELARGPRRTGSAPPPPAGSSLEGRREEAERAAIRDALEKAAGNRTQAARLLGISRRTLYNKLAELG